MKNKFFCMLVALVSFAIVLEPASGNDTVIRSSKLAKLEGLIQSLSLMRLKYGNEVTELPEIQKDEHGYFVDVGNLLDPIYKERYGKTAQCTGPNCFNLTMLKYAGKQRYVSTTEMSNYLSSHCKKIEEQDLSPGDVILFTRSGKVKPAHSATYIDSNYVLDKKSHGMSEGGKIKSLRDLMDVRKKVGQFPTYYSCDLNAKQPLSNSEKEIQDVTSCYIHSDQFFNKSTFLDFVHQFDALFNLIPSDTAFSSSIKEQMKGAKLAYYYKHPAEIPSQLNINTLNGAGKTLLALACSDKDQDAGFEKAKFFLSRGANPDDLQMTGLGPLALAQSIEMVQLLLDHGAKIDGFEGLKKTTLMSAFEHQEYEKFKYLVVKGAKLTTARGVNFFEWSQGLIPQEEDSKQEALDAIQFVRDVLEEGHEADRALSKISFSESEKSKDKSPISAGVNHESEANLGTGNFLDQLK